MAEKKDEKAVRRQIRRLLRDHADLVISELLEQPVWPRGLDVNERYQRFGDDDKSSLTVTFSNDGDAWPFVYSEADPQEPGMPSPRFRTGFGGGESLRVRAALLILAKAIQLDNEKRPQQRHPRQTP